MPSPYAIEQAMSAAGKLVAELGDGEDSELLYDALDGETDVLEIARKIIRVALDAESMAAAAAARVDDLNTRRDRYTARAQSARETVKQMLDALGVNRVLDPEFTVSLRLGPPKVLVTDEALLPDELFRVRKTPDLTAIGKALDAGPVQGAARSNGNVVLSIRTK